MTRAIRPKPGIMDIDLYVGGASALVGVDDVLKLSSNENPLGPSPLAQAAFRACSAQLATYPSGDHLALRTAIAEAHGLNADRIVCGAGSDEIISFLCRAFAGPGDEVLFTEHGFAMYRISALAAGATPVEAAETDRHTDVDALLAACSDRTKLVFVANPNNPTGTMVPVLEIARLAAGLPDQALLVLDSAYAEYVEGYDGGAALVDASENVLMARTFSKIYGLGSLRIGWAYGSQNVIDILNRVRGPFNVSAAALAAAQAALGDGDYTAHCRSENANWRAFLIDELAALGIRADPSCANFVLARFTDADVADRADVALKNKGIIVRKVADYKLPQALRITVGDERGCKRVIDALKLFKTGPG